MRGSKYINFLKSKKQLIGFTSLRMTDMSIQLLITILISRKLSINDYGIFSLILTILGFMTTFGFGWTSSSLLYFGVEEKEKSGNLNKTFWSRNIILLFSFVIVFICFFVFKTKINNYIGIEITGYLLLWVVIRVFNDYLSNYFLAIKKRYDSVFINLTSRIFMLTIVFMSTFSVKQLIIFNIISELISFIYVFKIEKHDFGKFEFDKKNFNNVLKFGLWQLFGFSGLYIINFGDNLVIKEILGVADVGIYNIAYKLYAALSSLTFILSSYYAPTVVSSITNKNSDNLRSIFYKDRYFIFLFVLIPHIIVILLSDQIITYMYGIKYIDASKILKVLLVGSLIKYYTVFNVLIYNCFKEFSKLQILNILQGVLNVIFDIIFIKKYGLIGAAYGTLLSLIVKSFFTTSYANYRLKKFIKSCK